MTLAERSARSGIGSAAGAEAAVEAIERAGTETAGTETAGTETAGTVARSGAEIARVGGRHCWVVDPPASPGRWPGVLVEWRRRPEGGWSGRVIWVAQDDDGPVVIESWLDAALLAGS